MPIADMPEKTARSFVDRAQRLREEKAAIEDDLKEVYAEVKAKHGAFARRTVKGAVDDLMRPSDKRAERQRLSDEVQTLVELIENGLSEGTENKQENECNKERVRTRTCAKENPDTGTEKFGSETGEIIEETPPAPEVAPDEAENIGDPASVLLGGRGAPNHTSRDEAQTQGEKSIFIANSGNPSEISETELVAEPDDSPIERPSPIGGSEEARDSAPSDILSEGVDDGESPSRSASETMECYGGEREHPHTLTQDGSASETVIHLSGNDLIDHPDTWPDYLRRSQKVG